MEKMRTAEEMLAYFEANGTGCGGKREENLASFKIIEKHLEPDEYAVFTFIALCYVSDLKASEDFANAVTNKRILMAKKVEEPVLMQIPRTEFRSMTMSWGKRFASLIFDAEKMQIRMEAPVNEAKRIHMMFTEAVKGLGYAMDDRSISKNGNRVVAQTEKMRTTEEMLRYCEVNSAHGPIKKKKAADHFKIIEECLDQNEYAVSAFTARDVKSKDDYAGAVSNKRILIARQDLVDGRILKFIGFDELEALNATPEGDLAQIQFEGTKMQICMDISLAAGELILDIFDDFMEEDKIDTVEKEIRENLQNDGNDITDRGMRTAEGMLQFCINHGTINDRKPEKRLIDFVMMADCMEKGEYAVLCFVGEYSETDLKGLDSMYTSIKEKNTRWACAFTTKRILMTQKGISPVRLKSIPYERIYDIFIGISDPDANIIISTVNGDLDIYMSARQGYQVRSLLNEIKELVPGFEAPKPWTQLNASVECDTADEIRKYKGLLDEGAITEEEYQDIKRELLKQVTTAG